MTPLVRDPHHGAQARALRVLTTDEPSRLKDCAWTALTTA